MYVQARQALDNIRVALERAGLAMHHVIRTRIFVTDMERFAEAARAHKEFFADSPPASTIVEVRRLANPDMMIEIEADAYAGTANSQTAGERCRHDRAEAGSAGQAEGDGEAADEIRKEARFEETLAPQVIALERPGYGSSAAERIPSAPLAE